MIQKILLSRGIVGLVVSILSVGACTTLPDPIVEAPASESVSESMESEVWIPVEEPSTVATSNSDYPYLIRAYVDGFNAKDVEQVLALYTPDFHEFHYPDRRRVTDIDEARRLTSDIFTSGSRSTIDFSSFYQIAVDQWVAMGELSLSGTGRGSVAEMSVFDFTANGSAIERKFSLVGISSFVDGPSVSQSTAAMRGAFETVFSNLPKTNFSEAISQFADGAELYAYPPSLTSRQMPVISGARDVASVLAFKWGEGAWTDRAEIVSFMQFVFVGIPGAEGRLDRVALFTFDADPASSSFEKIIRVDVMGPSGG